MSEGHEDRLNSAVRSFHASWSVLETTLGMYFGKLLLTDEFRARIVWNEMSNLQARLTLLRKLVVTYVDSPECDNVLEKLRSIEEIKRTRNTLAHSKFFLKPGNKERIVFMDDVGYSKANGYKFIKQHEVPLTDLEKQIEEIHCISIYFGARGNFTTPLADLSINQRSKWHREH